MDRVVTFYREDILYRVDTEISKSGPNGEVNLKVGSQLKHYGWIVKPKTGLNPKAG